MKSAYFIPYSMLSWCMGLRQLFWLDFYYTGICLLLCWQYYKLSRACGLGDRASMVFVIIQALLFGNNIFSFYRYYGISSSIYAQLGAVALTRIVLNFASSLPRSRRAVASPRAASAPSLVDARSEDPVGPQLACAPLSGPGTDARSDPTQCLSPIAHHPSPITDTPLSPGFVVGAPDGHPLLQPFAALRANRLTQAARLANSALPCSVNLFITVACLIALTAFNHPQGLGIAGLGIAAVGVWRLIEWKRSALWWLIGSTIIINVLFLWLYPRPAIIETYRAQGYLNAWYGFNILDLTSPAGDRMLQIVSAFGLVNVATALFLFRRNHVIAWLTLTPLLMLLLPSISIPFATALSSHGDPINIITFQRMLFAVPFALALTGAGNSLRIKKEPQAFHVNSTDTIIGNFLLPINDRKLPHSRFWYSYTINSFASAVITTVSMAIALSIVLSLIVSKPHYNRAWHTITTTPADLKMMHVLSVTQSPEFTRTPNITATYTTGTILQAAGVPRSVQIYRVVGTSIANIADAMIVKLTTTDNYGSVLCIPSVHPLISPVSLAGQLSTHWLPQDTPIDLATGPQLTAAAFRAGAINTPMSTLYFLPSQPISYIK
jgi:branched-subunit amino acid transport protein AzlD